MIQKKLLTDNFIKNVKFYNNTNEKHIIKKKKKIFSHKI